LFDGRIDKLTETLEKVIEIQAESQKQILDIEKQIAASRKESAESRKEFDERLNALINIVDDLIRKRPPQ
jgi:predicted  nucleic acid-binding Zn-ribbon protein